jgi:hypothetical protein
MLKGEQLDKYVQELRRKTFLFKKYKAEQNVVKAEYGILSRTQEVLQQRLGIAKSKLGECIFLYSILFIR